MAVWATRWIPPLALLASLASIGLAQKFEEDAQQPGQTRASTPLSKEEQRAKFHVPAVHGSSGEARLKSYADRLKLEVDSRFLGIPWRNVGPETQSGRVVDFDSPKSQPNTLYVAFATGGLWRTENDGDSWVPLFDHESAYAIGDFAVYDDGSTIWIGTGENNSQRTSYAGTGVFKSTDSGQTWQHMGLEGTHRIGRVLIDPQDVNTVYVAAIGALYSSNPERGVFKTTNGGKSWQHVLNFGENIGAIDLAMDPRDPKILYATTWNRSRRAWDFLESGEGSGVFKSINAGKSWTRLSAGLPSGNTLGRAGIAIAPSKPNILYLYIDNQTPDPNPEYRDEFTASGVLTPRRFLLLTDELFLKVDRDVLGRFARSYLPQGTDVDALIQQVKDKKTTVKDIQELMKARNPGVFVSPPLEYEVYRSDDSGKTWKKAHPGILGLDSVGYGYYCGRIVVSPHDPNLLYVTSGEFARSMDGGKTWESAGRDMHPDFHAVYFDRRNPEKVWVGNDGGPYLTLDAGKHWRSINNLPVGQFTTIAVDNKTPYNVYGGLQDNGTMKGPSNYVRGRSDPSVWTTIGGGDGATVVVDPRDNGVLYTGSQFGSQGAQDTVTGARWSLRPQPARGEPPLRFNWVSPLIVSPHHPDILYFGGNKLFRSLNQGRTWEAISPDLTKNQPQGNVPFNTIKDISESQFKFGLIYVGCDDGTVKITRDHGSTWVDISTPAPKKWVSRVLASRWEPSTVYVTQSGYRDDDITAYVWKSTDYGKTWKSIVGNLPMETVNVIREDPTDKKMLYLGTDVGVFVSVDSGATWEPYGGGIPRAPVHDMTIQPREDELVIATHSRSVWIAPLKYLRQIGDEQTKQPLALWPIPDMVRGARWGFANRDPWDNSPVPPPFVRLQAWSDHSGKGTLAIKDKNGKVVKQTAVDLVRGFNFLTIDLELKPASFKKQVPTPRDIKTVDDVLQDPRADERPIYVAAGEYKIELTLGDQHVSADWKLSPPP